MSEYKGGTVTRRITRALAGLLLLTARAALACPVCFSSANPRVLQTYYLTTVLMMLLPLVILGSIAGWLYVRFRDSGAASSGEMIESS